MSPRQASPQQASPQQASPQRASLGGSHGSAGVELPVDDALAAQLVAILRGGDVLTLDGDLGAGKTTLVQHMGRHWHADEGEIRSPTFSLMNIVPLADFELVHADLYRMEEASEVVSCGLAELLGEPDCVCVIEWPQLAAAHLPAESLGLALRYDAGADRRSATLNAALARRLRAARP